MSGKFGEGGWIPGLQGWTSKATMDLGTDCSHHGEAAADGLPVGRNSCLGSHICKISFSSPLVIFARSDSHHICMS